MPEGVKYTRLLCIDFKEKAMAATLICFRTPDKKEHLAGYVQEEQGRLFISPDKEDWREAYIEKEGRNVLRLRQKNGEWILSFFVSPGELMYFHQYQYHPVINSAKVLEVFFQVDTV